MHDRQMRNEGTARRFCQDRAGDLGLEMKVSRVDFTLDGRRARFYFTAEGRVDFRRLVKDLAKRFRENDQKFEMSDVVRGAGPKG